MYVVVVMWEANKDMPVPHVGPCMLGYGMQMAKNVTNKNLLNT
jgi:hypothetical protein